MLTKTDIVIASNAIELPNELAKVVMKEYEERPLWSVLGVMSFEEWFIWRMHVVFFGTQVD